MSSHASITILKPREQVEHLWEDPSLHDGFDKGSVASVSFRTAPGDNGTEIHVEVHKASGGVLGEAAQKLAGREPLAKVKDELRRFKQRVETGEIARSEASPRGERLEDKPKERAAQPLSQSEREQAAA